MKQTAYTALSAKGTSLGKSGGYGLPEKYQIETLKYNFTVCLFLEIFPFSKLKGQNTKNIKG